MATFTKRDEATVLRVLQVIPWRRIQGLAGLTLKEQNAMRLASLLNRKYNKQRQKTLKRWNKTADAHS